MKEYEILSSCLRQLREKTDFIPETALILGSGLGELAEETEKAADIGFGEIEGLPVSTVPGHNGRFVLGKLGGVNVIIMQGRVHYYEGNTMLSVVRPVRLMGMLGAAKLIVTNAAGAINRSFSAGELMLINGHISSFVPNPLTGPNIDELGERFTDMTEPYDKLMREAALRAAGDLGIVLREGVYCQLPGPSFETPQEIKMLSVLGADAVGMSTACEVIAARHMGMRVCGISCLSNMAAGIADKPLSHNDVMEASLTAGKNFRKLVVEIVKATSQERKSV